MRVSRPISNRMLKIPSDNDEVVYAANNERMLCTGRCAKHVQTAKHSRFRQRDRWDLRRSDTMKRTVGAFRLCWLVTQQSPQHVSSLVSAHPEKRGEANAIQCTPGFESLLWTGTVSRRPCFMISGEMRDASHMTPEFEICESLFVRLAYRHGTDDAQGSPGSTGCGGGPLLTRFHVARRRTPSRPDLCGFF
jgi:hypothetical protein